MRRSIARTALAAALTLLAAPAVAEDLRLESPDRRIQIVVATDAGGQPIYSLNYKGRQILSPSTLGLQFEQYQHLGPGMEVARSTRRAGEDRYSLVAGKTAAVRDRYNELSIGFVETAGQKRRLDLIVRAYDDGIAFRYRVPVQPALKQLRLVTEDTQFAFPADYDCHGLNLGRYNTSHEGEYDPIKASAIRPQHLYETPLLCRTGHGDTTFAIAEADLRDYAGMYITRADSGESLSVSLARRRDDPTIAVQSDVSGDGVLSPWRLIMLGDHPGRLIESTLMTSLNPPAEGDFSWVKPGKYAWDWWNGPTLSSVARAGMNNETIRAFIDFAAENGLEYMMIDDGWYMNSGAGGTLLPGANNMQSIATIDLPALTRYAAERNVGILLWVHWKLIDQNMDRSLPYYAGLGVKGIKVDFMDGDDQQMVEFYHRLMRTAAANKLTVNLHGAYRPTGLVRTWPNYITQEGVLGAEYNKWSRRITARHNVTIPFTRGLLGPYDYTPGGFGNVASANFRPQNNLPLVMTTRGHALAMYVVQDSPLMGVSDSPDRYRASPAGLDFIRMVPETWDETRVLSGAIGEHILVARRKGRDWFIGGMTNEQPRLVQVPLDFLPDGIFEAMVWRDGSEPTALETETRTVTGRDFIALPMAASGGGVLRLSPAR